MEYYYKIYGLIIKSEIEFPEAYEVEEQASEVEIKYGLMPDFIKKKQEKKSTISMLLREYKWFYFEKEGNFFIEKGISITVELDSTADEKHIRSLILGACLGSIMYQREIIAIHGAAVVWKDKAIIISGNSGAGKSTISTQFRKKGCLFLADDTVAIDSKDGCIYAKPSFPQQKLCKDVAIEFGYDLNDLILLDEEYEKYAVRLEDIFCPVSKEVAALVCLDIHDGDQLIVKEITSSMKLNYIISNLYTNRDFKSVGMNTKVFKKCLEMAQKVPVIMVKRPLDKFVAAQIVEQVITIIEDKNRDIIKENK